MTRNKTARDLGSSTRRYPLLSQSMAMASLPALCLLLYWAFGEHALIVAALSVPALVLGLTTLARAQRNNLIDTTTGLTSRAAFDAKMTEVLDACHAPENQSALFQVELDEFNRIQDRYGPSAAELVAETVAKRLVTLMRDHDAVTRLSDSRFGICLHAIQKLNLDICLQLSNRMQTAIEEPISIDGISLYETVSIGFCQSNRLETATPECWLDAANIALDDAQRGGPAAIRAFSGKQRQPSEQVVHLPSEVSKALDDGQIKAWFQPQLSTDTGMVSGFEALARWHHPREGLISPAKFLPVIEKAGLLEKLADEMMLQSFRALKAWDNAGVVVPQVGVNFAGPELNNPKLIEKIMWNLDRFDLSPDRLAVEVLETVVASAPDDMVARNINALSKLGCRIDLDDFGTGHASITSIRRFSVNRIKIDRSFVTKADRDPEQQRMIGAILTMAERLKVETLAEGVETSGEHALLSQLGCDHVQGFGLARPMPFDETLPWIHAHNAKLQDTPRIIGNQFG